MGFIFLDNQKYSGKDEEETVSCGGEMIKFNKDADVFDACDASSKPNECSKGFYIDEGDESYQGWVSDEDDNDRWFKISFKNMILFNSITL